MYLKQDEPGVLVCTCNPSAEEVKAWNQNSGVILSYIESKPELQDTFFKKKNYDSCPGGLHL